MTSDLRRALSICAVLLLASWTLARAVPPRGSGMAEAARGFLAALDEETRATATFPFDDAERFDWHYIPRERKGVKLGDLDETQLALARKLFSSALSRRGVSKVDGVLALEAILREMESTPERVATHRDPGRYHISIFHEPGGEPGTEPWAWRLEGHHLSVSFSSVTDTVSSTPLFLGANPAKVESGGRQGFELLGSTIAIASRLVRTLDEEQRAEAELDGSVPRDVILSPGKDEGLAEPKGLAAASMKGPQVEILRGLVDQYVGLLPPETAEREWKRIDAAGFENVRFAWVGATDRTHYFRVHGPHFVLEYVTTAGEPNHVHTVWRDLENDFGRDLLRRHLEAEHDDDR